MLKDVSKKILLILPVFLLSLSVQSADGEKNYPIGEDGKDAHYGVLNSQVKFLQRLNNESGLLALVIAESAPLPNENEETGVRILNRHIGNRLSWIKNKVWGEEPILDPNGTSAVIVEEMGSKVLPVALASLNDLCYQDGETPLHAAVLNAGTEGVASAGKVAIKNSPFLQSYIGWLAEEDDSDDSNYKRLFVGLVTRFAKEAGKNAVRESQRD